MSHRVKHIKPGEPGHTGTAFEETHIYRGTERVEVCDGPTAKIDARKWISNHNWRLSGDAMKDLELMAA